jgi:hypothetical protein
MNVAICVVWRSDAQFVVILGILSTVKFNSTAQVELSGNNVRWYVSS